MTKAEQDRERHRRIVAANGELLDLLDELYPTSSLPPLTGSDRQIGAWIGQRELIARLKKLREESLTKRKEA